MQINFTRNDVITRLAALALFGCCFLQLPARNTQAGTTITAPPVTASAAEVVILTSSVLAGLARGQTMRFTLFNPSGSPSVALRAQAKLFDAQSRVIAESAEMIIPPGEFRSFDFNRDDIGLAGEDGTGRLQVRGTTTLFQSRDINDAGRDQIPMSLELVDNSTGATVNGWYTPTLAIAKRV